MKYQTTIKKIRIEKNITQKELSKMLEIPLRTIESWETQKRKPPIYVEKLIIEKLESIEKK